MRKKTLSIIATILALICVAVVSVTFLVKKGEEALTENQTQSIAYLVEKTNYNPVQISAILSFIEVESDFDPSMESASGGFGLCMWLGKRYENLEEFADVNGSNINTLPVQLEFLIQELSPDSKYYALKDFGDYTVIDWLNETENCEKSIVMFRSIYAGLTGENTKQVEKQIDFAEKIYPTVVAQMK